MRQGVPDSLRAQFWNMCTNIGQTYIDGFYCHEYYQTLCEAIQSGNVLNPYPNKMFQNLRKDLDKMP